MKSQGRNPGAADVADGFGVVLDLLVAARQAQHRPVEERIRRVLQREEFQSGVFNPGAQVEQIHEFPAPLAGQIGVVQLNPGRPQLRGEPQRLVIQTPQLSDRQLHFPRLPVQLLQTWTGLSAAGIRGAS